MVRAEEHLKVKFTEIRELVGDGSVLKQLDIVRRRNPSDNIENVCRG